MQVLAETMVHLEVLLQVTILELAVATVVEAEEVIALIVIFLVELQAATV